MAKVPQFSKRSILLQAALDAQGYPVPEELFDALLFKQKINSVG
jgi:hypothetical protein